MNCLMPSQNDEKNSQSALHLSHWDLSQFRFKSTILSARAAPMGLSMLNYLGLGRLDLSRNPILTNDFQCTHSIGFTSILAKFDKSVHK